MIISQLLLTTFVLYWLQTQYGAEMRRLQRELTFMAIETRNGITDSLLYGTGNTEVRRGQVHQDDSLRMSRSKTAMEHRKPGFKSPDTIFIPVVSGIAHELTQTNKERYASEEKSDTAYTRDHRTKNRWLMNIDTASFRESFTSKMRNTGMDFAIQWDDTPHGNKLPPEESLGSPEPGPGFVITDIAITKFRRHIISKILPQIIFGLLLVMLTALAFFFSYRSIHEHIILSNLKNEFIGNITHELKTPVATLSVAIESLNKYNLKNEPRLLEEYLKLASLETRRLEELINRVLDHTMLQNGMQQLNKVVSDINSLITEVTEIMPQTFPGGSIEFFPSKEQLQLAVDPLFFKGAIINLIDNSLKYCDKEPHIKIISYRKGNTAIIEVNDNGPGIPEEYHNRIFEKFFRIPAENVHNVKGYGLGLSFVAQVIELHSGTVKVHNLNPGCSFMITLPINAEK